MQQIPLPILSPTQPKIESHQPVAQEERHRQAEDEHRDHVEERDEAEGDGLLVEAEPAESRILD